MKNKTKVLLISIATFLITFIGAVYFMVMNPFNIKIAPLVPDGRQAETGKRLEVSFTYKKQRLIASSQYAFWIEDMSGNYIDTVYVTQWTATGGFSYRPLSIPRWVSAATPEDMNEAKIDAISGATPRNGHYVFTWDFTDKNGNPAEDEEYRYFFEGTMNNEDAVIYTGIIITGTEARVETPVPAYTVQDSSYKRMLSNVQVTFIPG